MPNLVPIVPLAVAEQFAEQMKQPDLVFLTKENEKRILDQAHQQACKHAWTLKLGPEGEREGLCEKCGARDPDAKLFYAQISEPCGIEGPEQ